MKRNTFFVMENNRVYELNKAQYKNFLGQGSTGEGVMVATYGKLVCAQMVNVDNFGYLDFQHLLEETD